MEQAAQGSGHSPELSEFYECLDSALRHRVWILGGAAYSQELDSVILMGTLHLRDILWFCFYTENHEKKSQKNIQLAQNVRCVKIIHTHNTSLPNRSSNKTYMQHLYC